MNASELMAKDLRTLVSAKADDNLQFERHRYFVADRRSPLPEQPVFNLAVEFEGFAGKVTALND